MDNMHSKFIDIQHAEMSFHTKKGVFNALNDINLTVAKGEFITLIGHSGCLLYTSPSPRDQRGSRMPSSA